MTVLNSMLVLAAGLNLSSTLITLTSLAGFTVVAFYIFRLSLPVHIHPTPIPWNISGGLVFIALVLVLRQLTAIWSLTQMEVWGEDFGSTFRNGLKAGRLCS